MICSFRQNSLCSGSSFGQESAAQVLVTGACAASALDVDDTDHGAADGQSVTRGREETTVLQQEARCRFAVGGWKHESMNNSWQEVTREL